MINDLIGRLDSWTPPSKGDKARRGATRGATRLPSFESAWLVVDLSGRADRGRETPPLQVGWGGWTAAQGGRQPGDDSYWWLNGWLEDVLDQLDVLDVHTRCKTTGLPRVCCWMDISAGISPKEFLCPQYGKQRTPQASG